MYALKVTDGEQLPDGVWEILRCASCGGRFIRTERGVDCLGCGAAYAYVDGGSLDLRLKTPRDYPVTFVVGQPPLREEGLWKGALTPRPPQVDFAGIETPNHLTSAMLDRFPLAQSRSSMALDLGCGMGIHRSVCQRAGFQWVGLDYAEAGAPILGDGHALPFVDESFDFILTIAVLEHIRYPFVMFQEVQRVLKPGGKLIGTVAFLEPFHGHSYYHHTDLGTLNLLAHSGLSTEEIAPHKDWMVLTAQARMGLFPRMPPKLAHLAVLPIDLLHRLWWRLGRLVDPRATENLRLRTTTGAFTFVAVKLPQEISRNVRVAEST
jgi:SAM-dependent methyltransferase